MANKTGDSGINATPATRTSVFAAGMPAATTADAGVATATAARPDVCNPPAVLFVNPPTAAVDIGSG